MNGRRRQGLSDSDESPRARLVSRNFGGWRRGRRPHMTVHSIDRDPSKVD